MVSSFTIKESCATTRHPTKRAPDAGESVAISSSFLRLSIFLSGRLRRPRPSAGNANRWATQEQIQDHLQLERVALYKSSIKFI